MPIKSLAILTVPSIHMHLQVVYTGCGDEKEYGDCPEWDRILTLYSCSEEDMAAILLF